MKLTKDRALDLVQGNLKDAIRTLNESHPFEGNPFIHRQLLAALRDLERIR